MSSVFSEYVFSASSTIISLDCLSEKLQAHQGPQDSSDYKRFSMDRIIKSAFFFDFDGVLVDSTTIKTDAYRELFRTHGNDAVSRVVTYHKLHGGISRVDKIDHTHRHILNKPYSKNKVLEDALIYSKLVFEAVVKTDWIPGAREFVEAHYKRYPVFVISGTPEDELKEVIKQRNMACYFKEILGSPTRKPEHIRYLIKKYSLQIKDCLFIGDALTDYDAARETGMDFIGIQSEAQFPEGTLVLPDCTELEQALSRLPKKAVTDSGLY